MSDTEQQQEQPPQDEESQAQVEEDAPADEAPSEQQQEEPTPAETDEQQQEEESEKQEDTSQPEPEPTQPEPEPTQPEPEPTVEPAEPEPSEPEPEQTTTATTSEEDSKPEQPEVSEVEPAAVVAAAPVEEPKSEEKDEEVKEKPQQTPPKRSKFYSVDPREGVDIAFGEDELTKKKPVTVGQMFRDTVSKCPEHIALRFKVDGVWEEYTYTQYYHHCLQAAKSFLKLGLEEFHAVGILGFNAAEWHISNLGAMFAGGLACGIYATNGPEACQYVAEHSKANILVVENQKQLDKILQVRDNLPHLKAIVQYKGKLSQEYDNVYDWEQFMKLGEDTEDMVIEEKIDAQKPEQCALLVYTSGTTGNPKGVMVSHDNLTWTTAALHTTIQPAGLGFQEDHIISYLPLSHIAAQVIDLYLAIYMRGTVHFAQPDALKGTLLQTLQEVQPTMFFGVPRVWEKFREAMLAAGASVTGFKKKVATWAKGIGFEGNTNIQKGRSVPWGWTIANMLLFKKVREKLGLTRLKMAVTGAAPIHRDVLEYFMSVNIPVMEVYGMSENSGPQTLNVINKWKVGTCGNTIAGVQMKIDEPDNSGEGEICMYGRHVFMGYLNNEEKTKEAIDDQGWLHSGDIGKVDKDGFLSITGRIKEIIITSGGENMAPVPIEDRIKKEVPFLSNVMLIGDKRKYVTCLVTILCVMNPDTGEPEDDIAPTALKPIAALGSKCTKVSEIVQQKDEAVFKAIQEGLDRANVHSVSNAQKVQKFTVLERDFSVPGQELGPTLKLKRHVVVKKYAEQIEAMYEEMSKV